MKEREFSREECEFMGDEEKNNMFALNEVELMKYQPNRYPFLLDRKSVV